MTIVWVCHSDNEAVVRGLRNYSTKTSKIRIEKKVQKLFQITIKKVNRDSWRYEDIKERFLT